MTLRMDWQRRVAVAVAVATVLAFALLAGNARHDVTRLHASPSSLLSPPASNDGAVWAIVVDGLIHDYVVTANGHLTEFVDDGANGRHWNAYDLSIGAGGGGPVSGVPSAILYPHSGTEGDNLIHVYGRTPSGDLVEYVDNVAGGHLWNAYDLSVGAGGGGAVASDPGVVLGFDEFLHVYVTTPAGHLVEYVNDGANGHPWNAYDLSAGAAGGGAVAGEPTATLAFDYLVHVYARTPAGHLVEYVDNDVGGHLWNVYDLSIGAGGATPVAADPTSVLSVADDLVHVYATTPGGHLVEYVNDNANGHPWNVYDLSAGAGGGGPAAGTPSALTLFISPYDLIHVYVQTPGGDLVEYVNDNANGHPWNAYDLSVGAGGGGAVSGRLASVWAESQFGNLSTLLIHVYAHTPSGDLVEYVPDNANGHPWNAYDLSIGTGVR
ncbi:MAG TPA: hypothetical protein VEI83_14320 [Acidimicrobiales bacterium]|nr:hypothetical protein [Acidimicrobiales bacterium]